MHALFLVALFGPSCQTPREGPMEVRLYDLSGAKLLRCNLTSSARNPNQGSMRTQAPNGEIFQGEWFKLNSFKASAQNTSTGSGTSNLASLPSLPVEVNQTPNPLGWATGLGLGIDFDHFPATYFSFMLSGNGGTLIDGFFLLNSGTNGVMSGLSLMANGIPSGGLIGAAKDNKGHRYKLIG
jgi:hypothetical protein